MKSSPLLLLFCLSIFFYKTYAQNNIITTNPVAEQIMLGNYDPNVYKATNVISDHGLITQGINGGVSPDSLRKYLEVLATFGNRNTISDTVSSTRGIGAARRWVYQKFQEFSNVNENRIVVSYLQFDTTITQCSFKSTFRNIMAILPGS